MKLNDLKPSNGSRRERKRVGRGPGGTDKTAGRGHKGQKSRSGAGKGQFFEGGRSTLISRLPKRGFNHVGTIFEVVNLSQLELFEAGATVDRAALEAAGLVRRADRPVKLLARGTVSGAYTLHVDAASSAAVQAIEAAGGSVVLPTTSAEQEG
ncbi:50S ribosomal protein L15 [Deinococcus peraridilitoris]|uniref:Large ribosomal subunit protein uL15 n=1 Tax=Deinococcus peraridilitoris (strain DSM 19664 / LMG 22246 / CIP 109416 / KR-200) TaxID=937777 RepID=L0A657_DEIPD|nr:50S ribosomal protein L15 [Deinococcus peraridilitoris]AFZ68505.1 ribosomal protein L15, bacterial/organelle [Deinococcus peraridilitoris DSM 19664]